MPAYSELLQTTVSVSSKSCGSNRNGRELCSAVHAGNSTVCVGDYSGSPLVCGDGMLTGVLLTRTGCSAGSVYKFANVAHALQWLRGDSKKVQYMTNPRGFVQQLSFIKFAFLLIAFLVILSIIWFAIKFACVKMTSKIGSHHYLRPIHTSLTPECAIYSSPEPEPEPAPAPAFAPAPAPKHEPTPEPKPALISMEMF